MRIERSRNPRMQLAIKCNALEHYVSRSNRYCTVKGLLKTSEEHESRTLRSLLKCQHCSNKTAWRKLVPSPGETARLQCFLPAPEILYTSLLGKQNCFPFKFCFNRNFSFFHNINWISASSSSNLTDFKYLVRLESINECISKSFDIARNASPLASQFIFIFKTNASGKHVEYI